MAIANTFFWAYWTLAYLHLTENDQRLASSPLRGDPPLPLRPGPSLP